MSSNQADIHSRLLKLITTSNWTLFLMASLLGISLFPVEFALGIISGGLIVTVNFHLLARTLKKALAPRQTTSHNVVLAKYYIRFIISGVIIFILISNHYVDPIGLFIGLSIVVASITFATILEIKKLIFKEAV